MSAGSDVEVHCMYSVQVCIVTVKLPIPVFLIMFESPLAKRIRNAEHRKKDKKYKKERLMLRLTDTAEPMPSSEESQCSYIESQRVIFR